MAGWPARLCLLLALLALPLAADDLADRIAKAEHGDMLDQSDLGSAFFFGNDVPQDYKQAYIWCAIAVEGGFDDAAERRDKAAAQLTAEELEQAKAEVAALLKKIAEQQ